ncbi:Rrf2 family transcriptional regulator, partial [Clostridium butyricum]
MKLSTKGRYGVRAMAELAAHYGGAPISIKTISKEQNLS